MCVFSDECRAGSETTLTPKTDFKTDPVGCCMMSQHRSVIGQEECQSEELVTLVYVVSSAAIKFMILIILSDKLFTLQKVSKWPVIQ